MIDMSINAEQSLVNCLGDIQKIGWEWTAELLREHLVIINLKPSGRTWRSREET
jgi:hypothetical protein